MDTPKTTTSKGMLDVIAARKAAMHGTAAPPPDNSLDKLLEWATQTKEQAEAKTAAKRSYNFARIAEAIMDELVANELEDLLIVKDLEVGQWWAEVLTVRETIAKIKRENELARQKAEEDSRAKEALLARLTPEERRLLGL